MQQILEPKDAAMLEGGPSSEDDVTVAVSKDAVDTESREKQEEDGFCPLFMDHLPSNFADNPQLAAIASLLEEDNSNDDSDSDTKSPPSIQRSTTVPCAGGGKVSTNTRRNNKSRSGRSHNPYSTPSNKNKKKEKEATLGEAQLFLNMWKL